MKQRGTLVAALVELWVHLSAFGAHAADVSARLETKAAELPSSYQDFYSESAYLGRENLVASQMRFRYGRPLSSLLVPYLQAGSELMTLGRGNLGLDPGSSFAYLAPSLRWQLGAGFTLYNEARVRGFYRGASAASQQNPFDARAVLVYGSWLSGPLSKTSRLEWFFEPYAETLFTTADYDNVVADGFARAGVRLPAARGLTVDAFLEPFATVDRIGHYYYNRADLKPSVRVQFATSKLALSLTASYVWNAYFPYARYEPNPYAAETSGARLLFVVGGTL